MKKYIFTSLLIFTCLFTGKAQGTSTDPTQNKEKNHRVHNYHGKGDRHHKRNKLFHGHQHQGKDHARADTHSHHGKGRQGDKGLKDNK